MQNLMPANHILKTDYLIHDSEFVRSNAGRNIIPEVEKEPLWKAFLCKFQDPIIVILLVVWVLSVAISLYEIFGLGRSASCLIEPAGILIAIILATTIAFILEVNAEKEFKILNKAKDERLVRVLRWKNEMDARSGRRPTIFQIKKCDVCKGDVVRMESGDEFPADGILLQAQSLTVDESNYTGEPFTLKTVDADSATSESTYPHNFLLRGSTVIEGNATYKVTAVGVDTEEGKGAEILKNEPTVETPLNRQLNQLASAITIASYIVAALIVVGRMAYLFLDGDPSNNDGFVTIAEHTLKSIMLAVSLIVVSVPEGLPMSVTMSLALSMRKMLAQKNLVRKLHACETMGAATVICSDKTGTLTKNKMQVREFDCYYDNYELVAQSLCVNSTAELALREDGEKPRTVGNPTEGAILYYFARHSEPRIDYEYYRDNATIISQKAFTPETKYMSTMAVDEVSGKKYLYVKGAPEIVLAMCEKVGDGRSKEAVLSRLNELQEKGMRTLGFAIAEIMPDESQTPLLYVGTVGIQDPVRDDVRDAIVRNREAGVRVIMVTGDVAITAREIGREAGIVDGDGEEAMMSGAEFAKADDQYLKEKVLPTLKILSRARPEDKLRLVSLLQEMGEVVAVTGDGTNDALALKKAQVGLSMGDGTSRAKEASDITIIDNSFASINNGILWGRSLYMNIKRFILFQMTVNVCACLVVLLGAFLGLDSPLTVTQMLWVNLIMDTFAAIALSTLPPDPSLMKEAPRNPRSHIVDRGMGRRILFGGLFFFLVLAGLWQLLWHTSVDPSQGVTSLLSKENLSLFFSGALNFHHDKAHLSPYELGLFFSTFVLMQFWNIFNVRYFHTGSSFLGDIADMLIHPKRAGEHFSFGFALIAAVILLGQILIVNVAGEFFEVAPLPASDWGWLLLLTSLVLIVPDLYRLVRNLLFP